MAFSKNKGKFYPINRDKYKGDINKIVYRSNLERYYMNYFDQNDSIIQWNSEEYIIPYTSALDDHKVIHRYYMDMWLKIKTKSGKLQEVLVEVKPDVETRQPKPPKNGKMTNSYRLKITDWIRNDAKWKATKEYCKKNNMLFIKATELDK